MGRERSIIVDGTCISQYCSTNVIVVLIIWKKSRLIVLFAIISYLSVHNTVYENKLKMLCLFLFSIKYRMFFVFVCWCVTRTSGKLSTKFSVQLAGWIFSALCNYITFDRMVSRRTFYIWTLLLRSSGDYILYVTTCMPSGRQLFVWVRKIYFSLNNNCGPFLYVWLDAPFIIIVVPRHIWNSRRQRMCLTHKHGSKAILLKKFIFRHFIMHLKTSKCHSSLSKTIELKSNHGHKYIMSCIKQAFVYF